MKVIIKDEASFKAKKDTFTIGPSETGYTLCYSAENETFTEYPTPTPAGENLIVNGATRYSYFKLKGNVGEVVAVL